MTFLFAADYKLEQLLKPFSASAQANAVHLAAELPVLEGGSMQVLYPSSAKAGTDLQVCAALL